MTEKIQTNWPDFGKDIVRDDCFLVGGTFDEKGGKPSKIVDRLACHMRLPEERIINGGSLDRFHDVLDELVMVNSELPLRSVIWMPNVSNDKDKLLPAIKKLFPHVTLISSKVSDQDKYSDYDIVRRALISRSAGVIKIEKNAGERMIFKLLDPLGNCHGSKTNDVEILADIVRRLIENNRAQWRMQSTRREINMSTQAYGPEKNYLRVCSKFGEIFSKTTTASVPERFMGNSSTRCHHGFFSERVRGYPYPFYVTKRNIDKRVVSADQFVLADTAGATVLRFSSDDMTAKPSVDAGIHGSLYKKLPLINFIVHGHCYIEGAAFTRKFVPCGDLREAELVFERIHQSSKIGIVNLIGHGCVVMTSKVEELEHLASELKFIPRPFPENLPTYKL